MTGSLRLSALLLLLLSRWASADLETGEDEFVRSWVIIEEQLVPPSRDEPQLSGAAFGGGGGGGATSGRRITPKSVFVAPSFNKCSDGYRPDTMGRCIKVVKLNQTAQWDFLLKQLNSMYGPGGGFGGPKPAAGASAYQQAAATTTTTATTTAAGAEPPSQKTDSPGPFQLNIPLTGNTVPESSAEPDEQFSGTSTASAAASSTVTGADDAVNLAVVAGTTVDAAEDDADLPAVTAVVEVAETGGPRPNRNRGQQTTTQGADDDEDTTATVDTTMFDSQVYPTTAATDVKTKFVDGSRTTVVETTDDPLKTVKPVNREAPSSPPTVVQVTPVAVDDADTEEPPVTGAAMAATTTESADEEADVVTVLAVAASADRLSSSTRVPLTTPRTPHYTTVNGKYPEHSRPSEAVSPEHYVNQSDDPTVAPAGPPDCSVPNAHLYHPKCANVHQLQQLQQIQQQIQQQQFYQQQFYHQQQLLQQQHMQLQQQPLNGHVATALVKRPATGGGLQVRFPGDEDPAAAGGDANPVRFPGSSAPYRTTNKMYESSRHPTWWPTAWPEQQRLSSRQQAQSAEQQEEDAIYQQHRLQHHLPQKKQDVRVYEFGSRLPKTSVSSTTAVVLPTPPISPSSTQWFRQFFD